MLLCSYWFKLARLNIHMHIFYLDAEVQPVFILQQSSPDGLLVSSAYVRFGVYSLFWPFVPSLSSWLIRVDFCNFATLFLKYSERLSCS